MKSKQFCLLFCLLALAGCMPKAVTKPEVNTNAKEERENIVGLRDKDQIDDTGLTKFEESKKNLEENRNNVVEIKNAESKLKLVDPSWKDFPINIDFNSVPIANYFDMLTRLTQINFVVGDEVKGDLSLSLKDVSWMDSLDLVLKNKNLISEVDKTGKVVTIHSYDFVTSQSESLQKALVAKMTSLRSYSSLEPKTTAIIRLFYTKPDVLAQQLKDVIATLEASNPNQPANSTKSGRASFVTDLRTNSIIIQATPSDMEWIKTAINKLDRPTSQVLVEVFIVEATDNFEEQLGSRVALMSKWGNYGKGISGTGGGGVTSPSDIGLTSSAGNISNNIPKSFTSLGGVAATFGGNNTSLKVELQAMQQESLIKIVSNPKLFIVDNEQATISDGQEVPFNTVAQLGSTPTTQFKNVALQLQVKPTVIGDGNVYLDLTVNKDAADITVSPIAISKKELKTKLLVKDGGIAMIGGINKSFATAAEGGVPLLNKLPILGNLFKSKDDVKNRNQLYIFLAPKVL